MLLVMEMFLLSFTFLSNILRSITGTDIKLRLQIPMAKLPKRTYRNQKKNEITKKSSQ